jgi:hypothetical protein
VAAFDETDDLKALEQTRSRLETVLGADENWRALVRSGPHADELEDNAARRARDTRLEMALADNAYYRAWKHINEAIDALRDRGADPVPVIEPEESRAASEDGGADLPDDVASTAADGLASSSTDLPQHIVALIRDGTSNDTAPTRANGFELDSAAEAAAGRDETPEAQCLAPAPSRPGANPDGVARSGLRARPGDDREEATVTFVTREPRHSLLPTAELPADLGTERKSDLFERLRGVNDEPPLPEGTFAPLNGDAEEAEVTIVTAETIEQRQKTEERAGRVRRFRKALSGD